jgi:uncharacterized protein YbjT (DUF2867 family)
MKILVCGASGFVGRHLVAALQAAGHQCIRGVRRARRSDDVVINYLQDVTPVQWLPKLQGIEVVINAVGVLRDSKAQPMQQVLAEAPAALFTACAEAGIKRIVNFSALGIESPLQTPYFQRRREAEAVLFALPASVRWLNLRPSLVYGEDGASARMFRLLAALPVHGLPMGGMQALQPVHIDDIAQVVCRWLADDNASSQSVNASGAAVTTMRGLLDSYRQQAGHGQALHINVPGVFIKMAAKAGDYVAWSPLCSDTLTMLNAGNTGDNSAFAKLLGHTPLSYEQFIQQGKTA